MNSFSHYSFGAVCEWMFRSLVGLETDGPGFQKIVIRPGPPGSEGGNPGVKPIDWVKATYRSPRGEIVVNWRQNGPQFELETTLPANTSAVIHLPATSAESILESGQPASRQPGVRLLRLETGRAVLEVDSGRYQFVSQTR